MSLPAQVNENAATNASMLAQDFFVIVSLASVVARFHSELHVNVSDTLCIYFDRLRLVDSHWLFIVRGGRRLRCLRLQAHKHLLLFLDSANLSHLYSSCTQIHSVL